MSTPLRARIFFLKSLFVYVCICAWTLFVLFWVWLIDCKLTVQCVESISRLKKWFDVQYSQKKRIPLANLIWGINSRVCFSQLFTPVVIWYVVGGYVNVIRCLPLTFYLFVGMLSVFGGTSDISHTSPHSYSHTEKNGLENWRRTDGGKINDKKEGPF